MHVSLVTRCRNACRGVWVPARGRDDSEFEVRSVGQARAVPDGRRWGGDQLEQRQLCNGDYAASAFVNAETA
jgi:hypothetical protein